MITITDTARTHLLDLLSLTDHKAVRLSVNTKGCGGHGYQMDFTNVLTEDVVRLDEEHCVAIDPKSVIWLIGVEMDYVDNDFGGEFDFINPQEVSRCGCRKSFTTKSCG